MQKLITKQFYKSSTFEGRKVNRNRSRECYNFGYRTHQANECPTSNNRPINKSNADSISCKLESNFVKR